MVGTIHIFPKPIFLMIPIFAATNTNTDFSLLLILQNISAKQYIVPTLVYIVNHNEMSGKSDSGDYGRLNIQRKMSGTILDNSIQTND